MTLRKISPALEAAMRMAMHKTQGEYPNRRLNGTDEGQVPMSVGTEINQTTGDMAVVMRFPKAVAWAGFPPDAAIGMAEVLIKAANRAQSFNMKKETNEGNAGVNNESGATKHQGGPGAGQDLAGKE